jgi:DUF4097 and DUF4098 domain-containing protein YvlB
MMRTVILTLVAALAIAAPSAAQSQASAAARSKARADAERERIVIEHRERREQQQRRDEQRRQERREDQRVEQVETVSRSVKVGPQGELDLQNMSGSVTVTRGSGNELKIEAVKKARAATDEAAREMLQLVKIDIRTRYRVEFRTRYPQFDQERPRRAEHRNVNVSVAYTLTAPAGTRMRINTMSGNIGVSDIAGELALEAMSGNITVDRAARLMAAKTMSGNVAITDAKSDAILTTGSMSGDVTLRQVNARQIDAVVVSGTVSLIDVRFGRRRRPAATDLEGKPSQSGWDESPPTRQREDRRHGRDRCVDARSHGGMCGQSHA